MIYVWILIFGLGSIALWSAGAGLASVPLMVTAISFAAIAAILAFHSFCKSRREANTSKTSVAQRISKRMEENPEMLDELKDRLENDDIVEDLFERIAKRKGVSREMIISQLNSEIEIELLLCARGPHCCSCGTAFGSLRACDPGATKNASVSRSA